MGTVIVVGASSGIGLACAVHLASRGWLVFGASRTRPPGAVPFEWVAMDVTRDEGVAHGFDEVVARAGRVDAVVYSAGFGFAGAIEDTSVEEAREQFETNFFGALRVVRRALPLLRATSGRLIQISSIAGLIALPYQGMYCATKFALEGLTEALQGELHGSGVQVSLVEPGDFNTGFTANRRIVRAAGEGSAHRGQFARTLAVFEADERRAPGPLAVARVVHTALTARRPALRYAVGVPLQRWAITLKKLLPWRVFAAVLRAIYRIGGPADDRR